MAIDKAEKKLSNLKPFKKGYDPRRNITGQNKGSGWHLSFEKMLEKKATEQGVTRNEVLQELFDVAYEQAKKGNFQFFKDLMDRMYGPVKTQSDVQIGEVDKLVVVLHKDSDVNS